MIRFGTSGWRAVISDEFTFRNVRLVAQAIANLLRDDPRREPKVVVGYDTRFLSARMAREVASVFSSNRVRALLCARDAPTPAVSLAVRKRDASGALYVTASHNPPEYNGLKYFDSDGAPAPTALTHRIEMEILRLETHGFDERLPLDDRFLVEIDPRDEYIAHLKGAVDLDRIRAANLTLAVDTLWGTSREYLDRVLIESDCRVEVIHNFADPYFGGYSPECSPENLRELGKLVVASGASVGLATDGDGDRFGIVDASGEFVPADDVLALLLDYLAAERGVRGRFVRTVATSHLVDRVAAKYGIEVEETAVGFKYIGRLLATGTATVGGEQSAGFGLGRHLPEKDGILACLLVAEMLAARAVPLKSQLAELHCEHGRLYHEACSLPYSSTTERGMQRIIDDPPETLAGHRVLKVNLVDGIKFILDDDSWCLLRRSGTEPLLRLYGEAASLEQVERAIDGVERLVMERGAA